MNVYKLLPSDAKELGASHIEYDSDKRPEPSKPHADISPVGAAPVGAPPESFVGSSLRAEVGLLMYPKI
jgi:hypothetical protein